MATASVTNTFVAGTAAEAAEVNTNFTDLVTFLNNSVVHRDGSKAMTANLDAGSNKIVNLTAGTASTDAVNLGQLTAASSTLPLGKVGFYAEASPFQLVTGTAVTDLTGFSVTFTAVAGRLYRATGFGVFSANGGTGEVTFYVRNGSTALGLNTGPIRAAGTADTGMAVEWVGTLSAGSTTLKLSIAGSAPSTNLAGYRAHILVEDLGLA